jgi:hypothetical protein
MFKASVRELIMPVVIVLAQFVHASVDGKLGDPWLASIDKV